MSVEGAERPVARGRAPGHGVTSRVAAGRIVAQILLIGFAIVSVFPMVWLILAPSKTPTELQDLHPFAFGSFENYAVAWNGLMQFQQGRLLTWVWNSVWYTSMIVLIASVTAVMAGYALAATRVRFKKQILIGTLIAMIVPQVALAIPLFIEIVELGLADTPWSIILTGAFFPFGTFLAYIYFTTSIPAELYESAKLDGCGEIRTFVSIALPLAKGLIGMLAFFSFTGAWMNYFLPFVFVNRGDVMTLPVGLGLLFGSTPSVGAAPSLALAGLITALPVLLVFAASAKLLVRGVLAGSVKS